MALPLRQWLLHVHVLSAFHTCHGRHGMGMVRRGDDHGIDASAFLVEHSPEVAVTGSLGV
jgi:hypothetical protein